MTDKEINDLILAVFQPKALLSGEELDFHNPGQRIAFAIINYKDELAVDPSQILAEALTELPPPLRERLSETMVVDNRQLEVLQEKIEQAGTLRKSLVLKKRSIQNRIKRKQLLLAEQSVPLRPLNRVERAALFLSQQPERMAHIDKIVQGLNLKPESKNSLQASLFKASTNGSRLVKKVSNQVATYKSTKSYPTLIDDFELNPNYM